MKTEAFTVPAQGEQWLCAGDLTPPHPRERICMVDTNVPSENLCWGWRGWKGTGKLRPLALRKPLFSCKMAPNRAKCSEMGAQGV